MANTGNIFPTVGASVDRAGSTAWTNPGNVVSDNGSDATVVVPSDYLVTSGYDFSSIPDGSTILGITVRVEASESGGGNSNYVPQLHSNTTPTLIGSPKSAVTVSGTTKVISTNGSTSDDWGVGASLTAALVKDAGFGVTIWSTDTTNTLAIDFVTIAIEYLPPPVTLERGDAASTAYAPTVVSTLTVSLGRANAASSVQTPTTVLGSLTVTPGRADAPATASDVTSAFLILLARAEALGVSYAPTGTLGALTVSLNRADALGVTYAPTVLLGSLTASLDRANVVGLAYAPTISLGALTVPVSRADASGLVYTPISAFGALTVSLSRADGLGVAYAPTAGGILIASVERANAVGAAYVPTISLGALQFTLGRADALGVAYAPVISLGGITVPLTRADAPGVVYAPTISLGGLTITLQRANTSGLANDVVIPSEGETITLERAQVLGISYAPTVTQILTVVPAPALSTTSAYSVQATLGGLIVTLGSALSAAEAYNLLIASLYEPGIIVRSILVAHSRGGTAARTIIHSTTTLRSN